MNLYFQGIELKTIGLVYQIQLLEKLKKHQEVEKRLGVTLVGPHKDDLEFLLDDYNFYELKKNLALRIQEDRENKVTLNEYKVFTELVIKNQEKGLNLGINFNRDVLSNQLSKLSSNIRLSLYFL